VSPCESILIQFCRSRSRQTAVASLLVQWGRTVRLWDAATGHLVAEPLRGHTHSQCAVSDPSPFLDGHRTIKATTTMTSNSWNNHSISLSSNSIHALCNISELTEGAYHDDRSSTPFVLDVDSGWVVGPKGRLLFCVPLGSRYLFYNPRILLVIPRGGTELDLTYMAHGRHWQKCREG
jgi:hypothetical protein